MSNIDPVNPYQTPEALVQDMSIGKERQLVSGWRRLATYLVDVVCFYILFFIFMLVLIFAVGDSWVTVFDGAAGNLIGIGVLLVYYIGFEMAFARTPGKFALGTIVVDEKGHKPTNGQILGRSFARLIPFEGLSCIGAQSHGWHDSLSKTYVVKAG